MRFGLLPDVRPHAVEVAQVGHDVFLGSAAGRGADDDPAREPVLLAEFAHDAPQAATLVARIDLAGNADVVDRRHEHQKPAGHRRVRGEAGALGAERLLGDLDDDLLAFLQQLFDLWLGALLPVAIAPVTCGAGLVSPASRTRMVRSTRAIASGRRLILVRFQAIELFERRDDVGDVEKAVALEAEVNKRRLHAGQHFRYPALVQIANHAA